MLFAIYSFGFFRYLVKYSSSDFASPAPITSENFSFGLSSSESSILFSSASAATTVLKS